MIDRAHLIAFLEEDAPYGDITSESVIPVNTTAEAVVVVRERAVVAGLEEASFLFRHLGAVVAEGAADGDDVEGGAVLLRISGSARAILYAERTALNLIGRMSGIATATRAAVRVVEAAAPGVRVASTRKTCPGLRLLDKKAVVLGGGVAHRSCLSDMVLIKDNHLAIVGLEDAIRRARQGCPYHRIEAEVECPGDAVRAARAGADIVLLDNMSPEEVQESVAALHTDGLRERVLLEISGGVTSDTLNAYAASGADLISMGMLTHSVRNVDVSLDIVRTG
ncbi:carboxylating nicotinate-nucleotide diphosphorylase [Methanofollis fontis]|uniref:Nicotinate-nucleotide pyrophosphorylase [carboxylating] n=1 Tax=Methanofollis fontis TaxID=2052832 RepID=A0A483CYB6_9EURY|nr:carboxylating nicotinate-nucleotide diphosphorylase [Methanofollis fontis]TAJ44596.1 nicotinate-nucleotide diphosphorylase (carboxylating) [Methanofollis fontis]